MGSLLSNIFKYFQSDKDVRVLILGLDNAGKTTILYKLKTPEASTKIHEPTIGFNVETFRVWDLGGQTNIRPYWKCYFQDAIAVIFVVDSTDVERLDLARQELLSVVSEEEMANIHLLVFANKQDMETSISEEKVAEGLGLSKLKNDKCKIFKTSATKGEGLKEGFDWLIKQIK
ncbi:Arf GTPase arl1 [Bonamia ostreae]|uniref:Arf GTPase arl1 n=1 Tax=Bonamia ostreae TaxID=126728 RepID=A0ABV2ARW8_9EUKA